MLDDNVIDTLEGILSHTMGNKNRLISQLRDAEVEVENLRRDIDALENSAIQTAKAIESLRLTMRSGSRSLGKTLNIEDDAGPGAPTSDHAETRNNIQDLPVRDFRRDSSVAYFNQNRPLSRNTDYEQTSNRFNDRTITQSCTMLLREAGRPLHVNELYNLLIAGGMKFKGNNPTISVAVSLSRNTRFCKVDPGTFDLVIREARQTGS